MWCQLHLITEVYKIYTIHIYAAQSKYSQLHQVLSQWKYRLAHSTHFPELHSAPICPVSWLGRWAAPPDCLTWLQMVLKSRPGAQPEGPGPLRIHRNCAICSTHCRITLFNLDISYHPDLGAMFFIKGYGSETVGPRRKRLSLLRSADCSASPHMYLLHHFLPHLLLCSFHCVSSLRLVSAAGVALLQ